MSAIKLLILNLVVISLCLPAFADDFAPPWYRDLPLSYQVQWDFTMPINPAGIYPEFEKSVDDDDPQTYLFDGFATHIDLDSVTNWEWTGGGIHAINPQGASFACNVINWVDWMPEKLLRIQVTYSGIAMPQILLVNGSNPVGGELSVSIPMGHMNVDLAHFYEDWIILPNPDWEQVMFYVPFCTTVEQIYIDTVSPEPASMAFLGLGAIGLLRRRK